MGEQQVQSQAGLRSTTEADRETDGSQSVGAADQSLGGVKKPLMWFRPSANNSMTRALDEMQDLLSVLAHGIACNADRQVKEIRKFAENG